MFRSVHFDPSKSGNPDANFPVLIDHTMDLELVYWAAKSSGNLQWIDMANSHLEKVIADFIRPDGGTIQWGYFNEDTGAFVASQTRQGYADSTTWSRGQAWLLYSLVNAYAETGRADFLAAAKKVANYWLGACRRGHGAELGLRRPRVGRRVQGQQRRRRRRVGVVEARQRPGGDARRHRRTAPRRRRRCRRWRRANVPQHAGNGRGLLMHGARWVRERERRTIR